MKKILMYCHNGSGNHGCEAIVKSTTDLLNSNNIGDIRLISSKKQEDIKYGVDKLVYIYDEVNSAKKYFFHFLFAYLKMKIFKNYNDMNKLVFQYPYDDCGKQTISLSIGGDNYCYGDTSKYIGYHNLSKKYGHKTILWGCSIDPYVLENREVIDDLKSFDKIIVRETISYEAMLEKDLKNVSLYPDPAFTLKKDELFELQPKMNTVGINVSPLITKYEDSEKILNNYLELINYILNYTNMNITLIPHVIWEGNDDRETLKFLKDYYKNNNRIEMLDDYNCNQLKSYISNLRFLVAARTHASIAAYSSCVPTLVAGYSVKSKGIAKDLFGTYENYVVPVQALKDENDLKKAFIWMLDNELEIKNKLMKIMPEYIKKSEKAVDEIKKLM